MDVKLKQDSSRITYMCVLTYSLLPYQVQKTNKFPPTRNRKGKTESPSNRRYSAGSPYNMRCAVRTGGGMLLTSLH